VLAYNYGAQLPAGVADDRKRCCYVHPLWAPNGVVVTDDFPKDHYHHRGVFWAWQIVRFEGKQYDMWHLKGGLDKRFSGGAEEGRQPRSAFRDSNRAGGGAHRASRHA
jgi:hypothetical protein